MVKYLLSLFKFERVNFFLFGFAILAIICNFVLAIMHNFPPKMGKIISTKVIHYQALDGKDQDPFQTESDIGFIDLKHYHVVEDGDTFIKILTNTGIQSSEAYAISKGASRVYNIENLNIGQNINLFLSAKDGSKLRTEDKPYSIIIHVGNKIINGTYNEKKDSYNFKLLEQSVSNKSKLVQGFVKDSLYNSITKAGASPTIVMNYMKLLSHEVNFKRDIKANSEFKILFDYSQNSDGKKINDGDILYAYLSLNGRKFEIYQYKDKSGKVRYFQSNGKDLKNALLQKPVKQGRISSGFGVRVHPIFRYKKMHKGVDYAVKRGTPILSAGDGIVQLAQYNSGYGKYVTIKHNGEYTTLYAHMSKFHPEIKKGTRVKQGQVIGYVGSTGRTTGTHLHYEVIRYGKHINPVKVKPHIHNSLEGQRLVAFKNQKKKIDQIVRNESSIMLAKNHVSS